jgi:alkylation response protein AidB-like acyl-CoA dehydrogenase
VNPSLEAEISADQRTLVEVLTEFVNNKSRPIVEELDAEERFPVEIYEELGAMGMMGINVPVEDGGAGGSALDYALVMEILSAGYASVADQVGLVELIGSLISKFGTEEQKKKYLPGIFAGTMRCAYGLTEPNAGSDLGGLKTHAEKQADGSWVLNGEKIYIHNAPVADFAMILAITDKTKGKRGGMSMFLVDIEQPGVSRAYKEKKMGQKASPVGGFIFENVKLSANSILGGEGNGFGNVLEGLEKGRLGIASLANGISRAALDTATEHARSREQFGAPIASFQAIAFTLAEMATDYAASSSLIHAAARKLDANQDANAACSMAKLFASEAAIRNANRAVQVLGGGGYIRGVEAERLYRDVRITTIYEGTSEVQKLVISRAVLEQGVRKR